MEDLIKRNDAIRTINNYYKDECFDVQSKNGRQHDNKMLSRAMKAIPSARQIGKWIPCTERLPSEYKQYLCYQEDGDFYTYWLEDADWARKEVESNGIIAWMPLPEPYKDGDNE